MSRPHLSSTRADTNLPPLRKEIWTGDLSVSQRNGHAPNYQRGQMYTFSPNDYNNPELSNPVTHETHDKQHQSNHSFTDRRNPSHFDRMEPRYSMTAGTRSAMITKLREMGDEIDDLMRNSTSSCNDFTSSLLYLKDLIEDVFIQVSAQLEDLKMENSQLKEEGGRMDSEQVRRLEDHYQNKILQLESERDQLQGSINRIKTSVERGESAREEMSRKANKSDQISKEVELLEEERNKNRATIDRLNAKIMQLNNAKESLKKQAGTQDHFLDQIKSEAKIAINSNKDLERKVTASEAECQQLQRESDLLMRKNRELESEVKYLSEEKQKIVRQSKLELGELNDITAEKNTLAREIQTVVERLKQQDRNENAIRQDLQAYRRQLETERRRSTELNNLQSKYRDDFQRNLSSERDGLGRRLQEYQDKYGGVDRKLMDQLKLSDMMQADLQKYQKELEQERRRSNLLEDDYKRRAKEYDQERRNIMRQIEEENRNIRGQEQDIKSYNQKLSKCEDLLKDFSRQSDLQDKDLKGFRKEMEDQRRRSSLVEEESLRKLKALALENQELIHLGEENKEKHSKAIQMMKDFEERYKAAEKRYNEQTRKTDLHQDQIKDLMASLDEERRLSQIDLRDKKDLIKKIEGKNQGLEIQVKQEKEDFKMKQNAFFQKHRGLESYLSDNARQSDLMAQEMLQLREEYENERRRSMAFEQEQLGINTRMRELGDKYAFVASKLEESQGIFKNKEALFVALDKKHREIEKVLLDQTRKSQLDEDQIKAFHDELERERRKSSSLEQESLNKIKSLVDQHNGLNEDMKSQQVRHQKQLEMMQRVEERTRELQIQNDEYARRTDMFDTEVNQYKQELENERRRSMALEQQNKERLRIMEQKNVELLERMDQDRGRLGRNEEALKQAEIKYSKIDKILEDERRASQMSIADFGNLRRQVDDERNKSMVMEHETSKAIDELLRRNQRIESDADSLEHQLSESNKTKRSLQTKTSQAERSIEELSRMLDQASSEKERTDEAGMRFKEEIRAKEENLRREREAKDEVVRDLREIENKISQEKTQLERMKAEKGGLERQIQERERLLAQTLNNREYLSSTFQESKGNQKLLTSRVQELQKLNGENVSTFQKNYHMLKSEISYRDQAYQEKCRREELLSAQVQRDPKRVLVINPTRLLEESRK